MLHDGLTSPLLEGLNNAQRMAVECTAGPTMIIAGAGSGKTRVLTHRIAYLLEQGIRPWQILALTFTNKAAREMKARISLIVGPDLAKDLWMGTFHSVFVRILRRHADQIGYTNGFTIYDTDDSLSLIKQVMNTAGISKDQVNPNAVRSRISGAKNAMVGPQEYARLANEPLEEKIAQIYPDYVRGLKNANAMDFDDLLLKTIELFQLHKDILAEYQKRFQYILVDEYQDTNQAQYTIIKLLAEIHNNLSVVGDDAQSIYAFRGADISNILDFQKDYPAAQVFRLEQNYRSTQSILNAADQLIKQNKGQIEKTLFTENIKGEIVKVIECTDERDEAMMIVRTVEEELRQEKRQLKDFAVLYRTNAQSRAIEDGLRRQGIPYMLVGGTAFYKRKEIKDVLGYVRLIVNPNDSESITRVINYPARGIGATTVEKLIRYAHEHDQSVLHALTCADFVGVQSRMVEKIKQFANLISKYVALKSKMSPNELIRALIDETRILTELKAENTMESLARYENVQEFLSAVSEFFHEHPQAPIEQFLEEVSLVSEVDKMDANKNAVTLMTLHAAKGLEYPVVFVAGLEEGLFPNQMTAGDPKSLEEERRLLYVGITRAMSRCVLTYATSRMRFGETNNATPSRFVRELEESGTVEIATSAGTRPKSKFNYGDREDTYSHLLNGTSTLNGRTFTRKRTERKPGYTSDYNQGSPASGYSQIEENSGTGLQRGMRVVHEVFGEGRVVEVAGKGDKAKATVDFQKVGKKNLLLKFANLRAM